MKKEAKLSKNGMLDFTFKTSSNSFLIQNSLFKPT